MTEQKPQHGKHEKNYWKQLAGVLFIYLLLVLSAYFWVLWFFEWEVVWFDEEIPWLGFGSNSQAHPLGTVALILLFGFAYMIWFLVRASLQKKERIESWLMRALLIAVMLFLLFPFLYLAWRVAD